MRRVLAILFLVCLQSSAELTRLESKTRTLSEHIALHDLRIEELEQRSATKRPSR